MQLILNSDTRAIPFMLVQSVDHITGLTGLGSAVTVTISKNGGAFASPAGTIAEIGNGWYKLTPTSADTGTNGPLLLHATGTGSDPYDVDCQVVAFNPYDAVALGLSLVPANVAQINSVATTSVTAVNANIGTTQPLNFTGTGGSALVKGDMQDIAGAAVNTSTAQIGAKVVSYASGEDPATLVLDVAASSHNIASSIGAAINTAASGGGGGGGTVTGYAAGQDPATLVLDGASVESGITVRQGLRLMLAALAGVLSGGGTTTITIKAAGNPGTPRIVATVDTSNNRTALTLTP